MKTRQIILTFLFVSLALSPACAQSWVKKAAKSVLTIRTFAEDGAPLATGNGVFVGQQGEAVGNYAPFRGAYRAVAIDAAGKEWPVSVVLGANETYDVVKFRVDIKKPQPLAIAAGPVSQGTTLYLLPYREQKQAKAAPVGKTETVAGSYDYYTLRLSTTTEAAGWPLLDEQGQLVGLMQRPYAESDTLNYAVSARFADSLKIGGLSINDPALRAIHIKKALPEDLAQAQLTLFVASQSADSVAYAQLVDDFIAQFPSVQDGYVSRAQLMADANRYADADRDMEQAINVAGSVPAGAKGGGADEAHYSYSRLIYSKLIYRPEPAYEPWTFDKALAEAQAASAINPLAVYGQQQAYVLYAQKRYAEASAIYDTLFTSSLRSPELFYEASRCKQMQGDSLGQLALLDSAVSLFSRPLLREAAPYLQERAQLRLDLGLYREAVADLNDYEQLLKMQVTDQFFYLRFQAEQGGRLFQQALNDIAKAIAMNPQQELYYAEKASLEVRVGLYDDAMQTAQACIAIAPEYSDGHLFLGLAQCLKGRKEEGVKNLQRARELGDGQADALIEKYGK